MVYFAMLFWGVVVGLLARRKNRNPWGWGVAGALSWILALLVLAFMPYVCPKCGRDLSNAEGKADRCPNCGDISAAAQSASNLELSEAESPIDRGRSWFLSASRLTRLAIVAPIFWFAVVLIYKLMFDSNEYDLESIIKYEWVRTKFLKVALFPGVVFAIAVLAYEHVILKPRGTSEKSEP